MGNKNPEFHPAVATSTRLDRATRAFPGTTVVGRGGPTAAPTFGEKKQSTRKSAPPCPTKVSTAGVYRQSTPHPKPKFIPAKLPSHMAGMESARRSPATPSPGSSSMGIPQNPSPPSPHLYRAMGTVMMSMEGWGPNYCADTSVPGCGRRRRTRPSVADPEPRLSSGTPIREGACPSMCDQKSDDGDLRATEVEPLP